MLQDSYTPKVLYDKDADVLYLKYASNLNASAHEIGGHIVAYFDDITGKPTTITVMDYKWLEANHPTWRDKLPISIDFDFKVIPYL